MNLYRLYLISPLIIGLYASFFRDRRRAFLFLNCLAIFLFFALKSKELEAGDSANYYRIWEYIAKLPLTREGLDKLFRLDLERGFLLVTWLLSKPYPSGQYFFVFSAIIYAIGLTHFYARYCEDYVLAALMLNTLGAASFFLQATRQGMAICICLLSIRYCKERKLIRFAFMIFLAAEIHASALLFVIAYFAYGIKINWKSLLLTIGIALASSFLIRWITLLANYFMNENYIGGSTEETTGGVITLALYLSILGYCLFIRRYDECIEDEDSREMLVNGRVPYSYNYISYSHAVLMFMTAITFFSMRFFYVTVFERGSYYFLPFVPVAIRGTFIRLNRRDQIIARAVFLAIFLLFAVYKSRASAPMASYTFFWVQH